MNNLNSKILQVQPNYKIAYNADIQICWNVGEPPRQIIGVIWQSIWDEAFFWIWR